jgi:hypothetical protein
MGNTAKKPTKTPMVLFHELPQALYWSQGEN